MSHFLASSSDHWKGFGESRQHGSGLLGPLSCYKVRGLLEQTMDWRKPQREIPKVSNNSLLYLVISLPLQEIPPTFYSPHYFKAWIEVVMISGNTSGKSTHFGEPQSPLYQNLSQSPVTLQALSLH